jgi:hypothetical protein
MLKAEVKDTSVTSNKFMLTPLMRAIRSMFQNSPQPSPPLSQQTPQKNTSALSARHKSIRFESIEPRVLMAADLNPAIVAINSTISAPGEVDQYNFTVASDIKVVFDSLTNDPNMNWSLSGPQGAVVNGRNFTSSDSSTLGSNPVINLAAGDYTIAVNASSGATGGYGFRLLDLQSAAGVTHDTSVTGQISINSSRILQLHPKPPIPSQAGSTDKSEQRQKATAPAGCAT